MMEVKSLGTQVHEGLGYYRYPIPFVSALEVHIGMANSYTKVDR